MSQVSISDGDAKCFLIWSCQSYIHNFQTFLVVEIHTTSLLGKCIVSVRNQHFANIVKRINGSCSDLLLIQFFNVCL